MSRSYLIAGMVAAFLLASSPARAQEPPARADLEDIERSLESARSRAGRLDAEYQSVSEEQAELKRKLIASAARIQEHEREITAGEERLVELALEEEALNEQLSHRRGVMAEMLAALQKLEREPPPVLAVRPGDAVAAIRSAMLLATVVPQVRAEADALSRSLRELASLRQEIEEEKGRQILNQEKLEQEHEVIARLLEVKSELLARTAREREEAQERVEALAAEAGTLKELLAALEAERQRAEEVERARLAALEAATAAADAETEAEAEEADTPEEPETEVAALEQGFGVPSAEDRRRAMSSPDRLQPAVAFADAVGTLSLPATGTVLREFGTDDGFGGRTKGVSIETRPHAQVTAPNDGWVVYAGEFRGYGQLLIIDGGDGYHVLLAGMSRIDASLGQFVLAGEPVGVMGLEAAESAAIGVTSDQTKPVLYVEFRKEGDSIDPGPWWAAANLKARG